MNRKNLLLTLAIPVILCNGLQAQTTASRLVAQANWHNNGAMFVRNDSTAYTYISSARGGDLTHLMKYDNATNWIYVGDTAYNNAYNYVQEFDGNNNLTSNVAQYWNGTAWVNNTKNLYFYDTANRLTSMVLQSWGGTSWVNVAEDLYSYDAAGHVYSDQYMLWYMPTTTFMPSSQKVYFYDLTGNKTTELGQVYNSTLGTYDYSTRYLYTYNSANQLLTTTYSTWDGSAWVNSTLYTNTYDSTGNRTTQLYQTYDGTSSVWVNTTLNLYSSFTGSHMAQSETDQVWDTTGGGMWVNTRKYTYTYNSYSQMTSSTGISWNSGGFWEYALGDPMSNYYYGTYTTSSVTNISNKGGEANVYPVPAQNMLHIDLAWNEAQPSTITIIDVQGRIVRNWDAPSGTQYHSSISVDNFADGVYFIRISGAQGQIVKQLVVAH